MSNNFEDPQTLDDVRARAVSLLLRTEDNVRELQSNIEATFGGTDVPIEVGAAYKAAQQALIGVFELSGMIADALRIAGDRGA